MQRPRYDFHDIMWQKSPKEGHRFRLNIGPYEEKDLISMEEIEKYKRNSKGRIKESFKFIDDPKIWVPLRESYWFCKNNYRPDIFKKWQVIPKRPGQFWSIVDLFMGIKVDHNYWPYLTRALILYYKENLSLFGYRTEFEEDKSFHGRNLLIKALGHYAFTHELEDFEETKAQTSERMRRAFVKDRDAEIDPRDSRPQGKNLREVTPEKRRRLK